MTKKHFIRAAKTISAEPCAETRAKMADLILTMNDNPRFDKARFFAACGLYKQ